LSLRFVIVVKRVGFYRDKLTTARAQFPRWDGFVAGGLTAGLRIGELLALDWWMSTGARAPLSCAQHRAERRHNVKNHQQRGVDMSRPLVAALRWHCRQIRAEFAEHGLPLPGPVFVSTQGTRLDDSNTRNLFARICAKAELWQRSPDDMRHTFASLLLSEGRSIAMSRDSLAIRMPR
jgi:integrase